MRKEHRPYILKKLIGQFWQWYITRYIRPQFDALGVSPNIVNPRHLMVFGDHISVGDYLHLTSAASAPVKLNTWQGKNMQGHISIGNYALISPGTQIISGVSIRIGDNCMFAGDCYISDSDWHGLYNRIRPFRCSKPINIGNNVWLGHGVKVGKGVSIGENSVVAAGSVVVKDIPPNVVVGGNPAKVIKPLDPKKRMLKREKLFEQGDLYWQKQDELDRYFMAQNTWRGWFKFLFKPTNKD